jgi:hypothetical protein
MNSFPAFPTATISRHTSTAIPPPHEDIIACTLYRLHYLEHAPRPLCFLWSLLDNYAITYTPFGFCVALNFIADSVCIICFSSFLDDSCYSVCFILHLNLGGPGFLLGVSVVSLNSSFPTFVGSSGSWGVLYLYRSPPVLLNLRVLPLVL